MSGPECCSNPPTLNPSGGAGHVEKLGGVDTYLTGSPHSNLAVLLISDVFGTVSSSTFLSTFVFFLAVARVTWVLMMSSMFSFNVSCKGAACNVAVSYFTPDQQVSCRCLTLWSGDGFHLVYAVLYITMNMCNFHPDLVEFSIQISSLLSLLPSSHRFKTLISWKFSGGYFFLSFLFLTLVPLQFTSEVSLCGISIQYNLLLLKQFRCVIQGIAHAKDLFVLARCERNLP